MCGLAGFSGVRPADPTKLRILLMDNESRGSHSTGVYGKRMMKKLGGAKEFIKDVNFNHIASSNVVISHTRQATTGDKTKACAHPFMFPVKREGGGIIVGTHNGTIVNEYELESKIPGFKRGGVDSESIFKAIAHSGDKRMFEMCEGHMALAYIFDGKLHLYRRNSRPLFIGKAKEGYYYTSIKESLNKIGILDDQIRDVTPNHLIVFNKSKIEEVIKIPEPRIDFDDYTMYSWEWQVKNKDPQLFEDLTGKKQVVTPPAPQAEVTKQDGRGNTDTTKTGKGTYGKSTHDPTEHHKESALRKIAQSKAYSPLTIGETKMVSTPMLSGENILIPSNPINALEMYSTFVNSSIELMRNKCLIRAVENPLKASFCDSWVSKMDKVCVAPMFSTINYFSKEGVTAGFVDIDFKLMFKSDLSTSKNSLHIPHRESLKISVRIDDEDSVNNVGPSFLNNNPCYYYISSGFTRIGIPQNRLNQSSNMIKFKVFVYDIFRPGLLFSTSFHLERNTQAVINLIIPISLESRFEDFIDSTQLTEAFTKVIKTDGSENTEKYMEVLNRARVLGATIRPLMHKFERDLTSDQCSFYLAISKRMSLDYDKKKETRVIDIRSAGAAPYQLQPQRRTLEERIQYRN
jgi:hypothetical protein